MCSFWGFASFPYRFLVEDTKTLSTTAVRVFTTTIALPVNHQLFCLTFDQSNNLNERTFKPFSPLIQVWNHALSEITSSTSLGIVTQASTVEANSWNSVVSVSGTVELALTDMETRTAKMPGGMVMRLNAQFTATQLYMVFTDMCRCLFLCWTHCFGALQMNILPTCRVHC